MRDCPNCGEPCISSAKLAVQGFIPGVVAACTNCHAMVEFKNDDGVLSAVVAEWTLAVLLFASFLYFGVLWVGLVMFVTWRLLRLYFRVKGPLIDVYPNS